MNDSYCRLGVATVGDTDMLLKLIRCVRTRTEDDRAVPIIGPIRSEFTPANAITGYVDDELLLFRLLNLDSRPVYLYVEIEYVRFSFTYRLERIYDPVNMRVLCAERACERGEEPEEPTLWERPIEPGMPEQERINELMTAAMNRGYSEVVAMLLERFRTENLGDDDLDLDDLDEEPSALSAGTELRPWQRVAFGRYPLRRDHVSEPIEWLVLESDETSALLLAADGLETQRYTTHRGEEHTWETSRLREWLNDDFVEIAFSDDELKRLQIVHVPAEDNGKWGTSAGNGTEDRVWLLSAREALLYLQHRGERGCRPTEYARFKGAERDEWGVGWWWLRSPGIDSSTVAYVSGDGMVHLMGNDVYTDGALVRPVIRVQLT